VASAKKIPTHHSLTLLITKTLPQTHDNMVITFDICIGCYVLPYLATRNQQHPWCLFVSKQGTNHVTCSCIEAQTAQMTPTLSKTPCVNWGLEPFPRKMAGTLSTIAYLGAKHWVGASTHCAAFCIANYTSLCMFLHKQVCSFKHVIMGLGIFVAVWLRCQSRGNTQ
jgi:hypothetical protein